MPGLGLGLGLSRGGGVRGAATLAARLTALLGGGASFWLPGPDYWFTNAGKTNPAGHTDLIRVWADASANGRDLDQATTAARPQATLSGDYWRATFDGVDDCLSLASHPFGTGNPAMTFALVTSLGVATTQYYAAGAGSFAAAGNGFGLFASPTFGGGSVGKWSTGHAGGRNYNSTAATSTAHQRIIVTRAAGSTIAAGTLLYSDGTVATDAGGSSTTLPTLAAGPLVLGSIPPGGLTCLSGQVIAAVAVPSSTLTPSQVAALDALLAEVTP